MGFSEHDLVALTIPLVAPHSPGVWGHTHAP